MTIISTVYIDDILIFSVCVCLCFRTSCWLEVCLKSWIRSSCTPVSLVRGFWVWGSQVRFTRTVLSFRRMFLWHFACIDWCNCDCRWFGTVSACKQVTWFQKPDRKTCEHLMQVSEMMRNQDSPAGRWSETWILFPSLQHQTIRVDSTPHRNQKLCIFPLMCPTLVPLSHVLKVTTLAVMLLKGGVLIDWY